MDFFRESAIAEANELLAADTSLSATVFERFRNGMRTNRLVYGDRAIGIALRPHLLAREEFELVTDSATQIAGALEKIADAAVQNPEVMEELGLTEVERRLALVDPGYSFAGVTTRLDGFWHGSGVKFVEYNGENPSSLSDQEGLNRLLLKLPVMSQFARRYQLQQFSPVEKLLDALLVTYREWGGRGLPNVAILDWNDLPTANEFVLLKEFFESQDVCAIICSPDDLEYDDDKLYCGDFQIDLIYKRILIHEFLARYDEAHPLIRAYLDHNVCLVNSFRCKIMHKKAAFEFLTDELHQAWFTAKQLEAVRLSIPWTRRMRSRRTRYHGREVDLVEAVLYNREEFVLKPNDDYGGRGVYLGSRMNQPDWEDAVACALRADYVVQEAVEIPQEKFPIIAGDRWNFEPVFVDTNPFLFRGEVCGAMVRVSRSPIVNVTSGGGETGFFVIDRNP
jgi:uncharacterized circularly permuted ATP-grasp superfamily protein